MPRALVLLAVLLAPARVFAQDDCFPAEDSTEAQVFAAYSVPLAYAPARAPAPLSPGAVLRGIEVT